MHFVNNDGGGREKAEFKRTIENGKFIPRFAVIMTDI